MPYSTNVAKWYVYRAIGSLELSIAIFVLFMLDRGLSMMQIMVLETLFILLVLVLEVPSGAFADRYGRKLSMILCESAGAAGFVVFAVSHRFWCFLLAQAFLAMAWALMSGADTSLIYDSLLEDGRQRRYKRVLGRANFISMAGWGVASLLSGALAKVLGYEPLFYLSAMVFLLAGVVVMTMREPPRHHHLLEKGYFSHIKKAFIFAWHQEQARNMIVYFSLFAALGHLSWFVLQPYYADERLVLLGAVLFVYFITAGLGNIFAESLERLVPHRWLLMLLIVASSLCFIGMFFVSHWLAIALVGVMSFACGVRDVVVDDRINAVTASHHRATVSSIKQMGKGVMYALFALVIGWSTDAYGPATSFLIMGGCLLVFSIAFAVLFAGRQQQAASGEQL